MIVSSLVYTSSPPLPCPNATDNRTDIAKLANVFNCTEKCQSDYALAQMIAEQWVPDAVPPALLNKVAVGIVFADIVLLLLCTAVFGIIFFSILYQKNKSM